MQERIYGLVIWYPRVIIRKNKKIYQDVSKKQKLFQFCFKYDCGWRIIKVIIKVIICNKMNEVGTC